LSSISLFFIIPFSILRAYQCYH